MQSYQLYLQGSQETKISSEANTELVDNEDSSGLVLCLDGLCS